MMAGADGPDHVEFVSDPDILKYFITPAFLISFLSYCLICDLAFLEYILWSVTNVHSWSTIVIILSKSVEQLASLSMYTDLVHQAYRCVCAIFICTQTIIYIVCPHKYIPHSRLPPLFIHSQLPVCDIIVYLYFLDLHMCSQLSVNDTCIVCTFTNLHHCQYMILVLLV